MIQSKFDYHYIVVILYFQVDISIHMTSHLMNK